MIRKAALQAAVPALLVFMVFNAYLAISHLKQIQKSTALTLESSVIRTNIAGVLQDLTDMETGQRGYLLTAEPAYLQPYTDARNRLGNHFAGLRAGLADRAEDERSLEAQLESVAALKQDEIERTISLRQQGYRHRAFVLVNTNEGKNYIDKARGIAASLASMESSSFARFEDEGNASSKKAFSGTIISNFFLLVLTACLFGIMRHYDRGLERQAAQSRRSLAEGDAQLEKITSALSNQAASKVAVIEDNVRLLLEKYEGFLPREGRAYAGQIKEAAAQMEQLRNDLLGRPAANIYEKAA